MQQQKIMYLITERIIYIHHNYKNLKSFQLKWN
jgi:hypothetical protein